MKLHLFYLVLAFAFISNPLFTQNEFSFETVTTVQADTCDNNNAFLEVIDILLEPSCDAEMDQTNCPRCCVCCEYRCEYCDTCGHCTTCCSCGEPITLLGVIVSLIGGLISLLIE